MAGFAAIILISAILLLSGCFSLSRGAPPQQHYVLGGELVVDDVEEATPTLVGIRPPRMADYLASPYLVVRHGTHRVEFSEFHRWGEDLGRGISGTLSLLLPGEAPGIHVAAAPWPTGYLPDYLVQLRVLRFEGVVPEGAGATVTDSTAAGSSHLRASWEILRPLDGATVARGTTDVLEPGWTPGDHVDLVRRLDAALGALARELGESLAGVILESALEGATTPG